MACPQEGTEMHSQTLYEKNEQALSVTEKWLKNLKHSTNNDRTPRRQQNEVYGLGLVISWS